ncbi:MAG: hypothetical protein OEY01_04135 [Desulfobulbaceae bacterium]|nr:hypothetical protein [Desulfobulbaceae bacterium]HIJ78373.1 hypothetical protein [Deltaproteobacteria bacterium]
MADNYSILVAIHALNYQGKEILGENWDNLFRDLKKALHEKGIVDQAGSDELLLVGFELPFTAFTSVLENLARLKIQYEWQESLGPLPLQIVFHLEKPGDLPTPLRDVKASLWDLLRYEEPYVSRALKLQWEQLKLVEKMPAHQFEDVGMGLYLLKLADLGAVRSIKLFPPRTLPLSGKLPPCFYCGMTTHRPADCPSKMLTMATQGIPHVGYLPVETIGDLFAKAFASQIKLDNILETGLTSFQIRQQLLLQVYVAYFDLNRIFQPRFLWNNAFSGYSKWKDLLKPETVTVDSHSLHLALDCLRVGQYGQAEELFVDESRRPKGRQFHATIGRAFIALELERESDMGHFLESAAALAGPEKEKIYISLLLARFYGLQDNSWKAEHTLDNVIAVDSDCADALYLQVQLMARDGIDEKGIRQLRRLVGDHKELFIAALMDPQLAAIAGPVEEVLLNRLEVQRQEAEGKIRQVREMVQDVATWFASDDETLTPTLADLAGLEQQFERGSYYDNLEVAGKAQGMLEFCYRLQEKKLDELHDAIKKASKSWEIHRNYWKPYPYKSFFKEFHEILVAGKETLDKVGVTAEKNMYGGLYRQSVEMLDGLDEGLLALNVLAKKMAWLKIFFDGLKLFGRKLVATEIALLVIGAVVVPIVAFWLAGTKAAGIIELVRNPWVQKQALIVVTVLVAPFIALIRTLWALMES